VTSEPRFRVELPATMRRVLILVATVSLWTGLAIAGAHAGPGRVSAATMIMRAPARMAVQGPPGGNPTNARAAGPCVGSATRYVDCGNGTVTDTVTGLLWLKRADCFPESNWKAALQAAANLKTGDCGLTDGSSPGDWRLATKAEWEATIAKAAALGCTFTKAPSLTNDAGTACYGDGTQSSRIGVASNGYWSSTLGEIHKLLTIFPNTPVASFANLYHGDVITIESMLSFGVWPVRSPSQ
jgi:hypothetical protein